MNRTRHVGRLSAVVVSAVLTGVSCSATEASTGAEPAPSRYYGNCSQARAAGVTPIYVGEAGYAGHLDRDKDGIACE